MGCGKDGLLRDMLRNQSAVLFSTTSRKPGLGEGGDDGEGDRRQLAGLLGPHPREHRPGSAQHPLGMSGVGHEDRLCVSATRAYCTTVTHH